MCLFARGGDWSPGNIGQYDFLGPGGIGRIGNLECLSLKTLCSRDQLESKFVVFLPKIKSERD